MFAIAFPAIDPVVVQNMGVRTQVVRPQTLQRHLRTIGEVQVAEDEVSVVNLRFSGWVERIHVDRTGDPVRAGQSLFEIYSPELVAAQEEYLLALRASDQGLAASARRKLELWDLDVRDIDAIARSGEAARTIPIRAPSSGFVLHKSIVEGARVTAGKDLYRIGDLATIWVEAEVYDLKKTFVAKLDSVGPTVTVAPGGVSNAELTFQVPETYLGRRYFRVFLVRKEKRIIESTYRPFQITERTVAVAAINKITTDNIIKFNES